MIFRNSWVVDLPKREEVTAQPLEVVIHQALIFRWIIHSDFNEWVNSSFVRMMPNFCGMGIHFIIFEPISEAQLQRSTALKRSRGALL